jgi:hypothetical protein
MINKVGRHRPDRTKAAMIEWRLAIALDLQQNAILHMQQYAASAVATAANTLEDSSRRLLADVQRRGLLQNAHANEPKRPR